MVGFWCIEIFTTVFLLLPVQVALSAWALASQRDECPSGSEPVPGSCQPCQVGFYREAGVHLECQACPEGWVTREVGAWMESECNLLIGARGDCPSGQEWSSTTESCTLCPTGTYRTKGVDFWCYPCPPGQNTSGLGSLSIDDCIVEVQCILGTEWNETTSFCEPCQRDYFRSYSSGVRCEPCPRGHVTVFRGARSRSECYPYGGLDLILEEEDCPPGTNYNSQLHVCSVCPVGQYRAASDPFSACRHCPDQTSTLSEGATHQSLCMNKVQLLRAKTSPPGTDLLCPMGSEWFAVEEPFWGHLEGCRPCPLGTYRDQQRQHLCNDCPQGTSTLTIGATSRDLCENTSVGGTASSQQQPIFGPKSFTPENCPSGTSWTEVHTACLVCPAGTYSKTGTMCEPCPANHTTLHPAASLPNHCLIPIYTQYMPFFTHSMCPLGSEWDTFSNACRPCPRGWYRESDETLCCEICPQGLTTLTPGSRSRFLCAVPREVPGRLLISSDGCEPGYRAEGNRTYCVPCERGSYKTQVGYGPCTPCPSDRDGLPLRTLQRGASDIHHCLPSGYVTSVSPAYGPQAGGTIIKVHVDAPLDFRVTSITVGNSPCRLRSNYLVSGVVECVTGAMRRLPPPSPVNLQATGGLILTSPSNFTYKQDPTILSISRLSTIVSGGLRTTVTGTSLNSVSSPSLLLYSTQPSLSPADNLKWACEVISDTEMSCLLPDLSELLSLPITPPRRRRRSPSSQQMAPLTYRTGLSLDGVTYYRNLSHVMPKYGTLVVYPDPVFDTFTEKDGIRQLQADVTQLELKGSHLNLALDKGDYKVTVGNQCQGEVKSLTEDILLTLLCEDLEENTPHHVTVNMAELSVEVGKVMLVRPVSPAAQSRTGEAMRVVIPLIVVAAVIALLIIVIVTVHLYRKKRREKNIDYSPDSSLMMTAAQNGHVVDPRLPPLPVNSVFGPERVTVMPGTQGFTTVRSKRDRGVTMRQLALPPGGARVGGHAGMSVVEAVEIGNQDLLRFEMDPDETSLHRNGSISITNRDRPGVHFRWI